MADHNSFRSSCRTGCKNPIKNICTASGFPPLLKEPFISFFPGRFMEQTIISFISGLSDQRNFLRMDQNQLRLKHPENFPKTFSGKSRICIDIESSSINSPEHSSQPKGAFRRQDHYRISQVDPFPCGSTDPPRQIFQFSPGKSVLLVFHGCPPGVFFCSQL